MKDQRTLTKVEQEVFSAARHPFDFQPEERLPQIERHWPPQIRIPNCDPGNPAPFDMGGDAATDNFDFRQFRQFNYLTFPRDSRLRFAGLFGRGLQINFVTKAQPGWIAASVAGALLPVNGMCCLSPSPPPPDYRPARKKYQGQNDEEASGNYSQR